MSGENGSSGSSVGVYLYIYIYLYISTLDINEYRIILINRI